MKKFIHHNQRVNLSYLLFLVAGVVLITSISQETAQSQGDQLPENIIQQSSTATLLPIEACASCDVTDMQQFSITMTAISQNLTATALPANSQTDGPQNTFLVLAILGTVILLGLLLVYYLLYRRKKKLGVRII